MICKYCAQGNKIRNGEHWIVKSIVPASIKIVTCKNMTLIKKDANLAQRKR